MSTEKKIVVHRIGSIDLLCGVIEGKTPDDVIAAMIKLKETYTGKDILFDLEHFGYDGGVDVYIHERRLETDKEYNERLKKDEAKALREKRTIEQKERKELARLQKKYSRG